MVEFSATLSDALAPVTLISGVGLLLVSMSARYCHATSRIRQLLAERKEESEDFHEEIDQSIDLIYKRASLLKTGRFQQSSGFGNRNRTPLQPGLIPDEINDAAGLRDLYRDLELHLRQ